MKQICVISLARIISKTVKIYKYKNSVSCLDYINHMFQCRKLHNLIILILEDNMRFCRFCMYWQCNCQCSLHKLIDLETVHAMLKKWVSKPYLKTLHSVTTFFPILLHTQESPFKFLCQIVSPYFGLSDTLPQGFLFSILVHILLVFLMGYQQGRFVVFTQTRQENIFVKTNSQLQQPYSTTTPSYLIFHN